MRDTLIQSCEERVIAHGASNGGRCRLGFVKGLVDELYQRAPLMGISRDDINDKVRIIKGKGKKEKQREVSPGAILFHLIRGVEVRDKVVCRNKARKDKEAVVESRKKTKLGELISSAKVIERPKF
jgi:hypothetical protein